MKSSILNRAGLPTIPSRMCWLISYKRRELGLQEEFQREKDGKFKAE